MTKSILTNNIIKKRNLDYVVILVPVVFLSLLLFSSSISIFSLFAYAQEIPKPSFLNPEEENKPISPPNNNNTTTANTTSVPLPTQQLQQQPVDTILNSINIEDIKNFTSADANSNDILQYSDPNFKLSFLYPSDWTPSDNELTIYNQIVALYTPLENLSDISQATAQINLIKFRQNISLADIANASKVFVNQFTNNTKETNKTSIDGLPAFSILYSLPLQDNTTKLYEWDLKTVDKNKVYTISYQGEQNTFLKFLDEMKKIIGSLKLQ